MMSERYRRGVEVVQQLSSGSLEKFLRTSRIAEVAPDFARMVIEFAFGDLYSREVLSLRDREIVAIASLASLGHASPQLRTHVEAVQRLGLSKSEIVEILMQIAIYSGLPASLNALADCHDLLTEGDCVACACHS
jgi:4-carboxymuconolactone decarboxylase